MTEREQFVLVTVYREVRAAQASQPLALERDRFAYWSHNLLRDEARSGLVRIALRGWLGHAPTPSESVMFSRAYAALESAGLLVRESRWGGKNATHLRLTEEGERIAATLTTEGTTDAPAGS